MFEGLTIAVLVLLPLITGFIGYITNLAAVRMIFHPKNFVGVGPIGWQGVLPARNEKFANDVADNVGDVLSARELVASLDAGEMERLLAGRLDAELPGLVQEVAELIRPGAWAALAPPAQQAVIDAVRAEGGTLATQTFEDLQGVSGDLLDLRQLVVDLLTGDNVDRLVRLFQRMGRKELRFIEYYGGIFGLMIGGVQVVLFGLLGRWWMMPIIGVAVGLGTNWLALQMIFRPLHPKRYLGIVPYQGMFPKRQAEIAREYGEIAASEIFTPANLFRLVTEGDAGTRIAQVVLERVSARVDEQRPMIEMIAARDVDDALLVRVKFLIVNRVSERVPELQIDLEGYLTEKLDVAHLVETRLGAMSKPEFERMLRGVFEEDEWILIVIGGVLGGLVGLLQGAIVLAQVG